MPPPKTSTSRRFAPNNSKALGGNTQGSLRKIAALASPASLVILYHHANVIMFRKCSVANANHPCHTLPHHGRGPHHGRDLAAFAARAQGSGLSIPRLCVPWAFSPNGENVGAYSCGRTRLGSQCLHSHPEAPAETDCKLPHGRRPEQRQPLRGCNLEGHLQPERTLKMADDPLSLPAEKVLIYLNEHDPPRIGELAQILNLSEDEIDEAFDELLARGFVELKPS